MQGLEARLCIGLWDSSQAALVFQAVTKMLATYLSRFSAIADNKINCGPVLTWMEVSAPCSYCAGFKPHGLTLIPPATSETQNKMFFHQIDNKGNHLLVSEEASINVPAIAAAHVTKRYTAQANDELTFEVGDIVSVIDMPPKEDTGWWRGKHGFQVKHVASELAAGLLYCRCSRSVFSTTC